MSDDKEKQLWFGSKNYGYGWVPNTWQGWSAVGVYGVVAMISTIWYSNQSDQPQTTYTLLYTFMMLISTGILVVVSKLKGTKPSWRWGKDE